jgi:hypothetical protein
LGAEFDGVLDRDLHGVLDGVLDADFDGAAEGEIEGCSKSAIWWLVFFLVALDDNILLEICSITAISRFLAYWLVILLIFQFAKQQMLFLLLSCTAPLKMMGIPHPRQPVVSPMGQKCLIGLSY